MVLRRIDAAIARLETVARQPAKGHSPDMAGIEASNRRMRAAIRQSLQQIDELVSRHGSDKQS